MPCMPGPQEADALLVCPACGERHVVRVNRPPARVECGAQARVSTEHGRPEARVWPVGEDKTPGRVAMIVSIIER